MKANESSAKRSRRDDKNDQLSMSLSVSDLKKRCKELKLKMSGNKEELKKRLREAYGSSSSSSSSSSSGVVE